MFGKREFLVQYFSLVRTSVITILYRKFTLNAFLTCLYIFSKHALTILSLALYLKSENRMLIRHLSNDNQTLTSYQMTKKLISLQSGEFTRLVCLSFACYTESSINFFMATFSLTAFHTNQEKRTKSQRK